MGFIRKTPAGTYRACWRDVAGGQKSKSFRTKREASAYLAEVEGALNRGSYVDPHAGRLRFGDYAVQWLAARHSQITTAARDASLMRTHILPVWGAVPLSRIDHLGVQRWASDLAARRSPATVAKCHMLLSLILRAAVRDLRIGSNPADSVQLPANRTKDTDEQVITPRDLTHRLLPAVPARYRTLVALAGGTGLRWGECVGLRWDAVDLDAGTVSVIRVAVEVAGTVTSKPFPKSRASRRTVPLPATVIHMLAAHRDTYPAGPAGEVFTNTAHGPLRRTLFRSRVWRPALVSAGLLGRVTPQRSGGFRGGFIDDTGHLRTTDFATRAAAVAWVARHTPGGLRFHDLRHSYARI